MSLDRTRVEQQLVRAKEELGIWTNALTLEGLAADAHRGDPRWRSLNARIRQISRRLRTIGGIEKVNAECETRKNEIAEEVEAPPEPAPAPKAKKAKAEPKAEGGDAPKKEKKEKKPKE